MGKTEQIDKDKEEDDSSVDSSIAYRTRQMEPIFIGDIIEYNEPVKVFSGENLRYGMVKSVDRKKTTNKT